MTALPEQLAQIGLRHTGRHLDDLVALATRKRWGPAELLEHLAETERAGPRPQEPQAEARREAASGA